MVTNGLSAPQHLDFGRKNYVDGIPEEDRNDSLLSERIKVRVLPDGRMTARYAATYLGLSEKTLAMWRMSGKGPDYTRVGGRIFYYLDKLDAFIEGGRP